jgi:hypothetical protein
LAAAAVVVALYDANVIEFPIHFLALAYSILHIFPAFCFKINSISFSLTLPFICDERAVLKK